jgi:hypothetical protein
MCVLTIGKYQNTHVVILIIGPHYNFSLDKSIDLHGRAQKKVSGSKSYFLNVCYTPVNERV